MIISQQRCNQLNQKVVAVLSYFSNDGLCYEHSNALRILHEVLKNKRIVNLITFRATFSNHVFPTTPNTFRSYSPVISTTLIMKST